MVMMMMMTFFNTIFSYARKVIPLAHFLLHPHQKRSGNRIQHCFLIFGPEYWISTVFFVPISIPKSIMRQNGLKTLLLVFRIRLTSTQTVVGIPYKTSTQTLPRNLLAIGKGHLCTNWKASKWGRPPSSMSMWHAKPWLFGIGIHASPAECLGITHTTTLVVYLTVSARRIPARCLKTFQKPLCRQAANFRSSKARPRNLLLVTNSLLKARLWSGAWGRGCGNVCGQ